MTYQFRGPKPTQWTAYTLDFDRLFLRRQSCISNPTCAASLWG